MRFFFIIANHVLHVVSIVSFTSLYAFIICVKAADAVQIDSPV
jgi:hypothetical protein